MNAVSGLRTIVLATIAASAVGCAALRHEAMPGAAKDIDDGSRSVRTARQQDDWSTVWTAVYRNFHSAGFNGVDWRALKKTVADRIEAGLSEEEFTTLIDGTLARLDDAHTFYLDPEEAAAELGYAREGSLAGLGLTVIRGGGDYAVVGVTFSGGPADRGGLVSHDRIHAIDGHAALGADGEPDVYRLRGQPGTTAALIVSTPGHPEREASLIREQVDAAAGCIKGRILEDTGGHRIGYILFATMAVPGAADLVRAEFSRLSAQGPLDGLVLDLRINGGGDLAVLSSSLGMFMEGTYGKDKAQNSRHRTRYRTTGTGLGNSREVPMVVLVHEATSSAAELMAGALGSTGRARLVGQRTGGDTARSSGFRLPGGGLVSVGVAMFLLPDGSDPGWYGHGIEPDWPVTGSGWDEINDARDPGLKKAVDLLLD